MAFANGAQETLKESLSTRLIGHVDSADSAEKKGSNL